MTSKPLKRYLGDGVYADWDGMHVVLTVEDGCCTTDKVFLDTYVLQALTDYLAYVTASVLKEQSALCPVEKPEE